MKSYNYWVDDRLVTVINYLTDNNLRCCVVLFKGEEYDFNFWINNEEQLMEVLKNV